MSKSQYNILSEQSFNKWSVIKLDKEVGPYGKFKYYLCQCLCGNICSVRAYDLINGKSKCCGCYNCNMAPSNIFNGTSYSNKFLHNGIDRKDNLKGYIQNNCVPRCKICNIAKHTMTENQFYNWIKTLFNFSLIQGRIK